jgi:hypothetical protein
MSLVISGTGISPSNAQPKVFPNLARLNREEVGSGDYSAIFKEVDDAVTAELTAAGLPLSNMARGEGIVAMPDCFRFRECGNGYYKEVPTVIYGFWHHWKFERAWYYYRAEGAGIPPDIAEEFHKTWGRQVRVNGHCGCPSPLEQNEGFAIGSYHIDTPEGMAAFVRLLNSIYKPRPKE